MNTNQEKQSAALAALNYIEEGMVVGVGTGSTAHFFIDALAEKKHLIEGAVASSETSKQRLESLNIRVVDLNPVDVDIYVDGADEFDEHFRLIKGGGGAHTREKILATSAKQFICIVGSGKQVTQLGKNFPVPVEVIPMARSLVARALIKLGAQPIWREHVITDNGHMVLDAHHLDLTDPIAMEHQLKLITGVVESGIFAIRKADIILVGLGSRVETKMRQIK